MAKNKELDLNIGITQKERDDMECCINDGWNKEDAEKRVKDNDKLSSIIEAPFTSVFRILKKNKVKKLVVSFSGGNDSGGSDSAYVIHEEKGKEVETEIDIGSFDICSILERPIYDKYHGFAWNGEVNGECVWDVENEIIFLNGTETNYNSSHNYFEM